MAATRSGASPAVRRATIPELVAAGAARDSSAIALTAPGRDPLTYDGLGRSGTAVAARLRALGVRRGATVAVVLPNGPEAASVFLGVAAAASCAPLNPTYTRSELDFYLADLDAALLVTVPGTGAAHDVASARAIPLLELEPDPRRPAGVVIEDGGEEPPGLPEPGDVALVLHTSGTTSRPKMVPLTHANLAASAANVVRTLALTPQDRCLNVMPLFHIHGLVAALLASLSAGGSIACTPGFEAQRFFPWVGELQPTWYTAVPTMHQAVVARAGEHAELIASRPFRFIRSSSAALPPPVLAELEETFGAPVIEAYGMTEASHQMASNPLPPAARRPGSVGLPAGPEITILDEGGNELPRGSVGEIAIRGDNVFAGYAANPEANAAAFSGGWFRTGDQGSLDEDGYLVISGRLKEIINRGGEKIAPREVDEVLLGHPAVAGAVAFAVPHPTLGEDVAAAVTLRDGAEVSPEALRGFALERLADFKVPRRILVLDELPKGATGKVQRIGLAERLGLTREEAPARARPAWRQPQTELERDIAALWAELLDVGEVGLDDDFFALGGDSITAAELMATVAARGWTRTELPAGALLLAPSVERFAALVEHPDLRLGASLLVPLRDGDASLGRLFLVHTHEGHVLHYVPLALALAGQQPVFAFEAPASGDGDIPWARLEDLAAAYVAEIRSVQPSGPYWLGGACMGGMVAFEMARQLEAAGEEVALAVLINPSPGPRGAPTRLQHRLGAVRERIELHRQRGDLLPWLGRKVRRRSRPPGPDAERRRARAFELTPAEKRFRAELSVLRDAYVPGRFGGTIAVLRAPGYEIPCSYWRRHAARVRCETLPSAPTREEHTALLAGRIDAVLDAQRAEARSRARRRS